ncbi:MAG: O-antigen ligase family protein [Bacteroidetes bacterium]|nr:O-antigen ligase family protein [Bacteroidota bacterium]MBK8143512.1 O-antigen ligase family protein [Bacteroidota bacterium]MBP6314452.1 O-antigen ligase family protein [Chitinophagaceae bacterium]
MQDLVIILFSLPPIFYTGGRAGALVFLCLTLLTILLILTKKGTKSKIILVLSLIVGSTYLQSYIDKGEIDWNIQRSLSFYDVFLEKDKISVDDWREEHNALAMTYFRDNPIIGVGIGNFAKINEGGHEVHNSYISLLTESGVLGLLFFLVVIIVFSLAYLKYNKGFLLVLYYIFFILLFLGVAYSGLLIRERWIWMMFACIISFSLYKPPNAVTADVLKEANVLK